MRRPHVLEPTPNTANPTFHRYARGAPAAAKSVVASNASPSSSPPATLSGRPERRHVLTAGEQPSSSATRLSGRPSMTYERRRRGDMDMLEEAARSEAAQLDQWRTSELARRGFDEHDVELLVAAQVSLHDVDRLLDRGCPLTTALLILL